MKLCVHELTTELKQKITATENLMVAAFRPYIYRHAAPAGSIFLEVQDANGKLIKKTGNTLISSIGSNTYWHGYYRFLLPVALKAGEDYYVSLKGSGYTFGEPAYVGWANSFDHKNAFGAAYDGAEGLTAPLGLQIWAYKFPTKGDT